MGEELMAWVVLRDGSEASEDDLRTFCRERVAHFKVPRYIKFATEFPMTVTGKVQKFKMREMAIDELGLQSAAAITTA
jgi:fatty-acyl-CoA synthase